MNHPETKGQGSNPPVEYGLPWPGRAGGAKGNHGLSHHLGWPQHNVSPQDPVRWSTGHHAGFHRSSGEILPPVSTLPAAHLTSYLSSRHQSLLTGEHQESTFSSHSQPVSCPCWTQDTSHAANPRGKVKREAKVSNFGTFKSCALKEDVTHTFHPANLIREKKYLLSHPS